MKHKLSTLQSSASFVIEIVRINDRSDEAKPVLVWSENIQREHAVGAMLTSFPLRIGAP